MSECSVASKGQSNSWNTEILEHFFKVTYWSGQFGSKHCGLLALNRRLMPTSVRSGRCIWPIEHRETFTLLMCPAILLHFAHKMSVFLFLVVQRALRWASHYLCVVPGVYCAIQCLSATLDSRIARGYRLYVTTGARRIQNGLSIWFHFAGCRDSIAAFVPPSLHSEERHWFNQLLFVSVECIQDTSNDAWVCGWPLFGERLLCLICGSCCAQFYICARR